MEQRIKQLLGALGFTPAAFAERLKVQRSAISHLITGRNKPSFNLIQNILLAFPQINPDWLILGKGTMFRATKTGVANNNVLNTIVSNSDVITSQIASEPTPEFSSNADDRDTSVSDIEQPTQQQHLQDSQTTMSSDSSKTPDIQNLPLPDKFIEQVKENKPHIVPISPEAHKAREEAHEAFQNMITSVHHYPHGAPAEEPMPKNPDTPDNTPDSNPKEKVIPRTLKRVILMYSDRSFEDYNPA